MGFGCLELQSFTLESSLLNDCRIAAIALLDCIYSTKVGPGKEKFVEEYAERDRVW